MNLYLKYRNQLLISIGFFLAFFSSAQPIRTISLADGLPGNSIKCIYKDSKGLMWIATETGLCTYNGKTIRILNENDGLKYNLIWKITEDDHQNIWLSTYGNGIAKYDGKKFHYYSKKDGLVNDKVRYLFYSKKHQCMLFGTEDGLSIYNGKRFKNFVFKTKNLSTKFQVNYIGFYHDKLLIGAAYEPLYELTLDSKHLDNCKLTPFFATQTVNYTGFIDQESYFNMDFSNQFSAIRLDTKIKKTFGESYQIWDYAKGKDQSIYLASWAGNSPKGALWVYSHNQISNLSKKLSLPTNQFWCLYFDPSANQLWVGTIDRGIFVLDFSNKISYTKASDFHVSELEINSVFIDKHHTLWLGGNDFIIQKKGNSYERWDNKKILKKIIHYLNQLDSKTRLKNYKQLFPASNFVCHTIRQDHTGRIWAITNYGVIAIDQSNQVCQFLRFQETSGILEVVNKEYLFVAQYYSESYLIPLANPDLFTTLRYKKQPAHLNALRLYAQANKLWIASYTHGLFLLKNKQLTSFQELNLLSDNNVSEVYVSPRGTIYTGTMSGKIYVSKWINNQLVHQRILLPEKDIIGNSIFFIREYGAALIVGTNKGIVILKNNRLFKFIDAAEFLESTIYKDATINATTGLLHVASYSGLITLNLKQFLTKEQVNYPIHLESFTVNGIQLKTTNNISLPYDQQNIEIQFASNNSYNASKNRFRYKISGLSEEWSAYSDQNTIKLFALNPGTYHVIIEGKNIGTNEPLKPLILRIQIAAPLWKTWWFMLVISMIAGLILWGIIKRRIQQIRTKSTLERRIAETKLEALQSQMNPHFVFNAMNSIQNFVIDNHTDDALRYIGEFSKLMRQTLDFSQRTSIHLEEEIDYLNRYITVENLRRKIKVAVVIDVNPQIDLFETILPPMIVQPFVENVFVHAFDNLKLNPEMRIGFEQKNNRLTCTIRDNGKGFPETSQMKTSSKGIRLAEERIKLSNSSDFKPIEVISSQNGTEIQISF
jgi:ligand-binding sensor domain-containing protein